MNCPCSKSNSVRIPVAEVGSTPASANAKFCAFPEPMEVFRATVSVAKAVPVPARARIATATAEEVSARFRVLKNCLICKIKISFMSGTVNSFSPGLFCL